VTAAILPNDHEPQEHPAAPVFRLAIVLGLHVAALLWLAEMSPPSPPEPVPVPVTVRLIEPPPPPLSPPTPAPPARVEPPRPVAPPPKPVPPKPRPAVRPAPSPAPPPVLAAPTDNRPANTPLAVPPQPAAAPRQEAPATQAATPSAPASAPAATAARFDADYLQNPAPAYPAVSKRLGEEGTVHLLVRVSPSGNAERVQVQRSSGSPRLDEAAVKTVQQWRFVPARVGNEAVAATVVVPIVFRLDS